MSGSSLLAVPALPQNLRWGVRFLTHLRMAAVMLLGCASLAPLGQAQVISTSVEIENTGHVDFTVGAEEYRNSDTATVTVRQNERTPSTIIFYKYAPTLTGAFSPDVGITNFQDGPGGPLTPLDPPVNFGTTVPVDQNVPLVPVNLYHTGEPIFLTLEDLDQNLLPDQRESVLVTLTVSLTGDEEVLRFVETGPNTGLFAGYIQSRGGSTTTNDGFLTLDTEAEIVARYVDLIDGTDVSSAAALIDPFGIVFDSSTGDPINGATVTIIDNSTGQPADVFGDDGFSDYPSTVISGQTTTDSNNNSYPMPAGGFRFPLLPAGDYRLEITPPGGYTFPSVVTDAILQTLTNEPFSLSAASRGGDFTLVAGPALEIDVPLDPAVVPSPPGGLFLQKSASEESVAIGDFLRYDLVLENTGITVVENLVLEDRLPPGFRYQSGSAYLENQKIADPQIGSDGRSLTFSGLGSIDGETSFDLRYVVEVTAGARLGRAVNTAVLRGTGEVSNEAQATVTVIDDLQGENLLIGRVMIRPTDRDLWTKDDQTIGLPGLEGARIYLEDGSYVITDEEGRFHFEGVKPGVHVVQLDGLSVPERFEIVGIENTRFAGRDYSQFVDLQAGAMWRTDFFIVERAPQMGSLTAQLCETVAESGLVAKLDLKTEILGMASLRAIFMLPEGVTLGGDTAKFGDKEIPVSALGQTVTIKLGALDAGQATSLELPLKSSATGSTELSCLLFAKSTLGDKLRSTPMKITLDGSADCSEAVVIEREVPWAIEPSFSAEPDSLDEPEIEYDAAWLDRAGPAFDWVEPRANFVAAISTITVSVKLPSKYRVQLYNKGERVSGLYLLDSVIGGKGETSLRRWRGMNLHRGENIFEAVLLDDEDNEIERISRNFHYAGPPVKAEYVKEASRLVADGRSQPMIALRLTDSEGKPVRAGVRGQYSVDPPYEALVRDERTNRFLEVGERDSGNLYEVGEGGIAMIRLEPTSKSGEVTVRLDLNERDFDFQAWLEPSLRDWIMVGLGSGTVGYNDISSAIEELPDDDIEDDLYEDGRVAFFAKGRVKGQWLLTLAYDSDKESEVRGQESLHQVIDPDAYYTLYADETDQGYEAASAEKLYVKLEREKFYAVFGDFETGLNDTELTRYSRSLTGLRSQYDGENVSFNGFVSETDFAYIRDEIRGDGTSGLYRLSKKDVVLNSETIRIQTRDRFQSEQIINERILSRHLDYNINYDDSTIYFKSPVFSRDENLNPVYIIAEYEVEDGEESFNYGGRVAVKTTDERVELGATYVHESTSESEGDLYGADLTVQLNEQNELRVELAQSNVDMETGIEPEGKGDGYLVELEHRSEHVEAMAYFRQQDETFGLGQQNVSEKGTRKYGVEARYKLDSKVDLVANAFHEERLLTGDKRNVLEVAMERRFEDSVIRVGYIWAEDDLANIGKQSSDQLHFGVSRFLFEDRLVLRVDHYQSIGNSGESIDYPTRTIFGADYYVTERVRLFTEYEMTFGEEQNTQNARVGFGVQPWTGANVDSSLQQSIAEDGGRMLANFGLSQRLQLSEHWSFDGGVDSSRNFAESGEASSFSTSVPNASGNDFNSGSGSDLGEDFTAFSVSTTYREKEWSWNARLEERFAETEDRWSIYTGIIGEVDEGLHMGLQATVFQAEQESGSETINADIRYSVAYRPLDSEWIILNRLEFLYDSVEGSSSDKSFRVVNRGDINYLPHEDLQIAFQYGHKYVITQFDDDEYSGFTHFYGLETRYDIHDRIDIGLRGSVRHSLNSNVVDYSYGPSIGISPVTNLWVSLGYNVTGFTDEDFSDSNYTAQGAYVQFRFKVDQDTLKDIGQLLQHQR